MSLFYNVIDRRGLISGVGLFNILHEIMLPISATIPQGPDLSSQARLELVCPVHKLRHMRDVKSSCRLNFSKF